MTARGRFLGITRPSLRCGFDGLRKERQRAIHRAENLLDRSCAHPGHEELVFTVRGRSFPSLYGEDGGHHCSTWAAETHAYRTSIALYELRDRSKSGPNRAITGLVMVEVQHDEHGGSAALRFSLYPETIFGSPSYCV